jgi:hypothetical protein
MEVAKAAEAAEEAFLPFGGPFLANFSLIEKIRIFGKFWIL